VLEAVGVVSLLLRLLQLRGWRRKLTTQRRARTDARTNICIYTRACAHACTPTDAHVHADTDTDTGTQTCTRKRIYTQSRTHADKQSHPRTHRHIDTQKQRCQPQFHKKIKISTTRSRTGRRGQEKKRRWMQACPKRAGVIHVGACVWGESACITNDGLESVRINPVPCASSLCPPPCDPRRDSSYRHERAKPSGLHP